MLHSLQRQQRQKHCAVPFSLQRNADIKGVRLGKRHIPHSGEEIDNAWRTLIAKGKAAASSSHNFPGDEGKWGRKMAWKQIP